ncbi:MAG: hypothetical protein ACK4ZJ_19755, partial [Allorhizobium sp.]
AEAAAAQETAAAVLARAAAEEPALRELRASLLGGDAVPGLGALVPRALCLLARAAVGLSPRELWDLMAAMQRAQQQQQQQQQRGLQGESDGGNAAVDGSSLSDHNTTSSAAASRRTAAPAAAGSRRRRHRGATEKQPRVDSNAAMLAALTCEVSECPLPPRNAEAAQEATTSEGAADGCQEDGG